MASFDGNGLEIDRLADIRDEIEGILKASFGNGIDLSDDSPFGVLVGIVSERYSLIYELLEAVYLASFPNTSFGVYLDEACAFNGVLREEATASVVNLTFTRSNDTNGGDVTIPAGTQCTASGGSTVVWVTDVQATILDGEDTAVVQATSQTLGAIAAPGGTIDTLVAAVANVDSVTNLSDATQGQNRETDEELRVRRVSEVSRPGTPTESGIRSALVLMEEVRNASVLLNDTDETVGGLPPHSFQASVVPATGFNIGMDGLITLDGDFVIGNNVSIDFNGESQSAFPFINTHLETLDQCVALIQAYDKTYKAQHDGAREITIQGATNEDFTVSISTTGGASQPTGTFTQVNPAGTTLDKIAQKIWDSKGAGIQTEGGFSGAVVDSLGEPHTIKFSEIDEVRIYTRYTLTVDSTYDSAVAEAAIATAVAEWGTLNLTGGKDLLNYKLLSVASQVNVAGVLDIVVENSINGVDYAAVNRPIDADELALLQASDVSFVYP